MIIYAHFILWTCQDIVKIVHEQWDKSLNEFWLINEVKNFKIC